MCVQVEEGRRRKCRPIILLNQFSAEKAKIESNVTKHSEKCETPSAHDLPSLHIIPHPLTVLVISVTLSLSTRKGLSVVCTKSWPGKCCLDTACLKKKKNHINISLEERISASNGIGLQERRIVWRGARGWIRTEAVHN